MRTYILPLAFLLLAIFATGAPAADLTFAWDPNIEADLAGYRLYMSEQSGAYEFGADKAIAEISPAETSATIAIPAGLDKVLYFVLTAFDDAGNESAPSNEISQAVDTDIPGTPQNFKLTIKVEILIEPR